MYYTHTRTTTHLHHSREHVKNTRTPTHQRLSSSSRLTTYATCVYRSSSPANSAGLAQCNDG